MRFTDRGDGPPDYQVNISTFSLVLGIPLVIRALSCWWQLNNARVGQLHRTGRSPSNRTISVPNVPLGTPLLPLLTTRGGSSINPKCWRGSFSCGDLPCGQSFLGTLHPDLSWFQSKIAAILAVDCFNWYFEDCVTLNFKCRLQKEKVKLTVKDSEHFTLYCPKPISGINNVQWKFPVCVH